MFNLRGGEPSEIQRFDPFPWNSVSSTILDHSYRELWRVQSFDQSACNSATPLLKITLAKISCVVFWVRKGCVYTRSDTRSIMSIGGQPKWCILGRRSTKGAMDLIYLSDTLVKVNLFLGNQRCSKKFASGMPIWTLPPTGRNSSCFSGRHCAAWY